MRFRVVRLLGPPLLLFSLGIFGCSGSQDDEEDLEVTQQDNQEALDQGQEDTEDTAYDQEGDQGYADQGDYADQGNYADQEESPEGMEDTEGGDTEGTEYVGTDENTTENDLQEIIQEMNAQQTAVATDAEPVEDAMAMDTPIEDTTAQMAPDMMASAPPAQSTGGGAIPFQPGGTPAGQGLPEMGSKMPYIVQPGDTLGKISARIFGDMNRWREMSKLTGLTNPNRVYPGDVIYYTLDESSLAFATAYENVSRSEEQVQSGDTLVSIASRVYGRSNGWKSIWRQNDSINNPDVLNPGSTVYYIQAGALAAEIQAVKVQIAKAQDHKYSKDIRVAVKVKKSPKSLSLNNGDEGQTFEFGKLGVKQFT
jgi:nucleoid-associated protein YgaU